jgi:YVTN family beta-propeller protein
MNNYIFCSNYLFNKLIKMKYLFSFLFILLTALINSQVITDNSFAENPKRVRLPFNRLIQPAGLQVFFGDKFLENHSLDAALSPDGKWLAVEERYSIVFISTSDNLPKFRLPNNISTGVRGGMNTYSGIIWHSGARGNEVLWSAMDGNQGSFVASASWDGTKAEFMKIREFKTVPPAEMALPNEILIVKEGEKEYLYVVLNGNNQVVKQDLETDSIIWTVNTGVAPYGLTMASGKLFITNWAGRNPEANDKNVAGVPWGLARVTNKNGATREGSVTIINPLTGTIIKELVVGLHPNEIVSDIKGKFVYVTNSNSDNVSVINVVKEEITETISVRLQPEINPFFGDSPNGLCLSVDEKYLYVANGMDNAIAVIALGKSSSLKGKTPSSKLEGFIPTGAYPAAVCQSKTGILYVSNLEAGGFQFPVKESRSPNPAFNSHRMPASVSIIKTPDKIALKAYTDTVIAVNDLSRATLSMEKPRKDITPKPVPDRIGEPSVFKHVLYIIKENRTYDQLLGDIKQGDGDSALCIYGKMITPNTHKLAEEFMLLDNFHVSGKCSAEGHQWTDASIVTDYIEKNMRAWFRSYAHVQTDALVYAPTGFIWDNAVAKGKKVRIYGEAAIPEFPKSTTWTDVYTSFLKGEKVEFTNITTIDPVRKILSEDYPSYGNHEFPDVMRADVFIKELKKIEALEGDQLPELMVMALPNDHTGGTRQGLPTPRAMVADNDLALGRIVEAMSKSRFWENSVIFVVEDDSQGGWDHVSAYRTVGLVISPYSRLKTTNHTYYTQPSVVRTIEQILGLPPMNIQDAIANPMADCFSSKPDKTPYTALANNIPLNEMNPSLTSLNGKALYYARKSHLPEFDGIDSGNDDLLNRILWFSAKGNAAYPSKYAGATGEDEEESKK